MRAVFLDRDGVINPAIARGAPVDPEGGTYTAPFTPDEFSIFPGVGEAIQAAKEAGFLVILVTNQPDVGYGNMTETDFEAIMAKTECLGFDEILVCRHGRDEGCSCKKPKPGLILEAAQKREINLAESYMIGDTASDIGAGKAAGCRTILIARPYNAEVEREADLVAHSLPEAILYIQSS